MAPLTVLISIYFAFLGGNYMWYFFLIFIAFIMIGDLIGGNDITVEEYKYPFILFCIFSFMHNQRRKNCTYIFCWNNTN